MGQESIQQIVDRVMDGIAAKREAAVENAQDKGADGAKKEFKEFTLKFGKGCVSETFQGNDKNMYKEMLVANPDKNDHRPWQTFVVRNVLNILYENHYKLCFIYKI